MTASSEVIVQHKVGLHARPAALFVKTATNFSSNIQIENLTKGTQPVNAKSLLRLLTAAVQMNDRLLITAEGDDEEKAVAVLCDLINTNFGETE